MAGNHVVASSLLLIGGVILPAPLSETMLMVIQLFLLLESVVILALHSYPSCLLFSHSTYFLTSVSTGFGVYMPFELFQILPYRYVLRTLVVRYL